MMAPRPLLRQFALFGLLTMIVAGCGAAATPDAIDSSARPVPASAGGFAGRDPAGSCQATVPAIFSEAQPGSGYFPALDRFSFVSLDSADAARAPQSLDEASRPIRQRVAGRLPDYRETSVAQDAGVLQVEFTARLDGYPGTGVTAFRAFGATLCAVTLFTTLGAGDWFDTTLDGILASLAPVGDPRQTAATPSAVPHAVATPGIPAGRPAPGGIVFGGVARETKDGYAVDGPRTTFAAGEPIAYAAAWPPRGAVVALEQVLRFVAADGTTRVARRATIAPRAPSVAEIAGSVDSAGLPMGSYQLALVSDGTDLAVGTFTIAERSANSAAP